MLRQVFLPLAEPSVPPESIDLDNAHIGALPVLLLVDRAQGQGSLAAYLALCPDPELLNRA